jgi:Holliday junction resolvase RusA-like endonuclease
MKVSMSMGRKIEFTISGEPVAQGRPRFSNRGGFVKAYDPAKSRNGKQHVRYAAKHAMEGEEPLEGPLHMRAEFGIMMPKSLARKRTPRSREYRVKKPDLDNLIKLVKDGCSGVVYLDDNTVVMVTARKIQCAQGEAPFTRVSFEQLEELNASLSDSS